MTEADLRACIGRTVKEVIEKLELKGAEWFWVDEPPAILRGVSYSGANGREVLVYLAEGELLFRRFNDNREWDYEKFLACRVGGIQHQAGGRVLEVGSAVPWQWRRR